MNSKVGNNYMEFFSGKGMWQGFAGQRQGLAFIFKEVPL
jgi:hypothetical protein